MRSSGFKKGLAVSAVSALAMTGASLLVAPAYANPIPPNPNMITLLSPGIHPSSSTGTVNLVVNSTDAVQMKFEASTDGGVTWSLVANVTRDSDGLFRTPWTAPVNQVTTVKFRFTGLDASGNPIFGETAAANTVGPYTVDNTIYAASLDQQGAHGIGVWKDHATITGSTTAPDGAPGIVAYGQLPLNTAPSGNATVSGGKFSVPLDLSGYTWGATNKEIIGVYTNGNRTQDSREYDLYQQSVSSATASGQSSIGVLNASDITIKVVDQYGAPIKGAEVFEYNPNTNKGTTVGQGHVGPPNGNPSVARPTDANGDAVFPQMAAGTYNFAVYETTTVPAHIFIPGSDHQVSITVPTAAGSASTTSKLGGAFDVNEGHGNFTTPHDNFTTAVKDANGNLMGGKVVYYHWHYKPFASEAGGTNVERDLPGISQGLGTITQPGGQVDTRNVTSIGGSDFGTFNPWLPTLNNTDLQGGTFTLEGYVKDTNTGPGQVAGDVPFTYSVEVGQAQIVWSDGARAQRQDGTTQTFKGTVELPDGTVLGGQRVNVASSFGDATVATSQPAGTTYLDSTDAAARTAADGTFSVAINDPTPGAGETVEGGDLTATGSTLDTQPPTPYGYGIGTDASSVLGVQLLKNMAPAHIALNDETTGNATPGQADHIQATVTNADNIRLLTPVTFSVDHGYLDKPVVGDGTRAPSIHHDGIANQLPNSLTGVFQNDGTSGVVAPSTDHGHEYLYAAIGRDAGFDVNGKVDATITATAGSASATVVHHWSTAGDPVNWVPGAVKVSFTTNQQQGQLQNPPGYTSGSDGVTSLPAAAGNRQVFLDAVVLDQFGNRTGASVTATNSAGSQTTIAKNVFPYGATTAVNGQFTSGSPALLAYDQTGQTADEMITLSKSGATSNTADATGLNPVASSVTESSAQTINWYALDYAHSTFSLTHTGAATQAVNSTVTVTYHAVDQKGNPIAGLPVAFYRGGPDVNQNGEPIDDFFRSRTDQNGNAYYVFKGVAAGVGSITAIPADQNNNPIPSAQRDTTITFGTVRVAIHPTLRVTHGRHGDQLVAAANTNQAAGAKVNFYAVAANGHRTLIGTRNAGLHGVAVLSHRAPKGTRRYVAVFNATAKTTAGTTAVRSIR